MKIRTVIIDVFILMLFLAGSVYSYTQFKYGYHYALLKQKVQQPRIYNAAAYTSAPDTGLYLQGMPAAPASVAPFDGRVFYNGPGNSGIGFFWKSVPGAASYTIRISARADLRQPIVKEAVPENFFILDAARTAALPERIFYWAVSQTDFEGEVSPYGEPRSFQTSLFVEK